ncbi:hypothetical protein B0H14DRAFT_2608145 [Mycena olivaceomarginata]|nr:hypothetical protein B0H14DRAFT_2608145 [Mycena olivaceomarginata]
MHVGEVPGALRQSEADITDLQDDIFGLKIRGSPKEDGSIDKNSNFMRAPRIIPPRMPYDPTHPTKIWDRIRFRRSLTLTRSRDNHLSPGGAEATARSTGSSLRSSIAESAFGAAQHSSFHSLDVKSFHYQGSFWPARGLPETKPSRATRHLSLPGTKWSFVELSTGSSEYQLGHTELALSLLDSSNGANGTSVRLAMISAFSSYERNLIKLIVDLPFSLLGCPLSLSRPFDSRLTRLVFGLKPYSAYFIPRTCILDQHVARPADVRVHAQHVQMVSILLNFSLRNALEIPRDIAPANLADVTLFLELAQCSPLSREQDGHVLNNNVCTLPYWDCRESYGLAEFASRAFILQSSHGMVPSSNRLFFPRRKLSGNLFLSRVDNTLDVLEADNFHQLSTNCRRFSARRLALVLSVRPLILLLYGLIVMGSGYLHLAILRIFNISHASMPLMLLPPVLAALRLASSTSYGGEGAGYMGAGAEDSEEL